MNLTLPGALQVGIPPNSIIKVRSPLHESVCFVDEDGKGVCFDASPMDKYYLQDRPLSFAKVGFITHVLPATIEEQQHVFERSIEPRMVEGLERPYHPVKNNCMYYSNKIMKEASHTLKRKPVRRVLGLLGHLEELKATAYLSSIGGIAMNSQGMLMIGTATGVLLHGLQLSIQKFKRNRL